MDKEADREVEIETDIEAEQEAEVMIGQGIVIVLEEVANVRMIGQEVDRMVIRKS